MELHDLRPAPGSKREPKRLGQGLGSGNGKTAGKGTKGQKARAGRGTRPGFEGGQMPLSRRTPKKGFSNARFAKSYQVVNLAAIEERFENGAVVDVEALGAVGLAREGRMPVKILALGELTKAFTVRAHAFSTQAMQKIEAAGGKAEVI